MQQWARLLPRLATPSLATLRLLASYLLKAARITLAAHEPNYGYAWWVPNDAVNRGEGGGGGGAVDDGVGDDNGDDENEEGGIEGIGWGWMRMLTRLWRLRFDDITEWLGLPSTEAHVASSSSSNQTQQIYIPCCRW